MKSNKKLECECERCFKKISLEEYELNDFMCEDRYQEVHTDKNGNFHDDEYFDFRYTYRVLSVETLQL